MPRYLSWIGAALLAGGLAGCATSADEERRAEVHQYRADRALREHDYARAQYEQRKADEARMNAQERARTEQEYDEPEDYRGEPQAAPVPTPPAPPVPPLP